MQSENTLVKVLNLLDYTELKTIIITFRLVLRLPECMCECNEARVSLEESHLLRLERD